MQFLTRKWNKELDYRLIKELWAFLDNRIAVRFAYEWHDDSGNWFRSYGNENWEFDALGYMRRRIASINDLPISERDRKYDGRWDAGRTIIRDSRSWVCNRAEDRRGSGPRYGTGVLTGPVDGPSTVAIPVRRYVGVPS